MNINRHNYEAFFLMYVDNELTEAQRAAVDAFAKNNFDLQEELSLLQQSVLVPAEDDKFDGKEFLYKNEQAINLNNYEVYFLMHVDNELGAAEKNEVEKFVLQHPEIQGEFILLQQTKLPIETMEYKDKAFLFRTEEKQRRIIPMYWRVAAAAAVTGIIATVWFTYNNGPQSAEPSITAQREIKSPFQPKTTNPLKVEPKQQLSINERVAVTKVQDHLATKRTDIISKKPVAGETIAKQTNEKKQLIDKGNLNQLPIPENNPVLAYNIQRGPVDTRTNTTETAGKITEPTTGSDASYANNKKVGQSGNLGVQHALFKEMEDDDKDNTLYIGGAQINKNKLRGLFKKAATFFEKKARKNDGDNTIQIAGFQIKTK